MYYVKYSEQRIKSKHEDESSYIQNNNVDTTGLKIKLKTLTSLIILLYTMNSLG